MLEWFSSLGGLDKLFAACAVLGGGFTLVRLSLQLLGGGADVDTDFDADVEGADATFGLLSLQGLSAFFMMFGLVGLGAHIELELSAGAAILGGIAAGLFTTLLMARIFDLFRTMQSSGNIDLINAVGTGGTVYLTVHAGGAGKVRLIVQKRMRVLDAVTLDGADLPTGTSVVVTGLQSDNVLVVSAQHTDQG